MDSQEALGIGMIRRLLQLLSPLLLMGSAIASDVVIVTGAPGTDEFAQVFASSADAWADAAQRGGAGVARVGGGDPGEESDLAQLEKLLGGLVAQDPSPLWIVLLGHGTFDGRVAKFNLRGEDLSAATLAGWLEGSRRPIAIINTSASSAPFIKALSGKNRIVMTATKSGTEDSYARFGKYLAESIDSADADIDQDGATSLLEAFLSATKQVKEFYEKEGRIATEQALVDDNGDSLGTPANFFRGTRAVKSAKDGTEPDGLRAHQWHLVPSEAERNLPDALRAKRDALEAELFALRARKGAVAEGKYFVELERIALALAEIYREAGSAGEGEELPPDYEPE